MTWAWKIGKRWESNNPLRADAKSLHLLEAYSQRLRNRIESFSSLGGLKGSDIFVAAISIMVVIIVCSKTSHNSPRPFICERQDLMLQTL